MKKSIATVLLIFPLSVSLAKPRIADASTSSNEYFHHPYPYAVAKESKIVSSQLFSQYQSQRSLIGKMWQIDLGEGKVLLWWLFCNNMRYEIQGTTISFFHNAGRYATDGNYLTTRREDGLVESFNLRWGSTSVELVNRSSGKVEYRLYYYNTVNC